MKPQSTIDFCRSHVATTNACRYNYRIDTTRKFEKTSRICQESRTIHRALPQFIKFARCEFSCMTTKQFETNVERVSCFNLHSTPYEATQFPVVFASRIFVEGFHPRTWSFKPNVWLFEIFCYSTFTRLASLLGLSVNFLLFQGRRSYYDDSPSDLDIELSDFDDPLHDQEILDLLFYKSTGKVSYRVL